MPGSSHLQAVADRLFPFPLQRTKPTFELLLVANPVFVFGDGDVPATTTASGMRHCHKAGISMRGSTAGFKAGTSNLLSAKTHQQARCTSMAPQPQPALHLDSKAIRTYSQRTAAAAPDTLVAEETVQQPSVEFLGVLKDMQTVKGVIHTAAAPDLVFDILTDYDSCSRVFRNISGSQTLFTDAGDKQVIQVCRRLLACQAGWGQAQ